jgi:hypothetical protein
MLSFSVVRSDGMKREIVAPSSNVVGVTVYNSAAEISRSFSISELKPGYGTITLKGLPKTVDEKSIRISGVGNIDVLNTIVKTVNIPRNTNPEFVKALDELKHLLCVSKAERALKIDLKQTRQAILQSFYTTQAAEKASAVPEGSSVFDLLAHFDENMKCEAKPNLDRSLQTTALNEDILMINKAITELETQGTLSPSLYTKFKDRGLSKCRQYWPSSISQKEISLQVRVRYVA